MYDNAKKLNNEFFEKVIKRDSENTKNLKILQKYFNAELVYFSKINGASKYVSPFKTQIVNPAG